MPCQSVRLLNSKHGAVGPGQANNLDALSRTRVLIE
jgi:hypothetical protein